VLFTLTLIYVAQKTTNMSYAKISHRRTPQQGSAKMQLAVPNTASRPK